MAERFTIQISNKIIYKYDNECSIFEMHAYGKKCQLFIPEDNLMLYFLFVVILSFPGPGGINIDFHSGIDTGFGGGSGSGLSAW
jgi:hypothetical protein